MNNAIEIRRNVVVCLLLKCQQNLLCLNRRRGSLNVELRLTRGAGFLLFARSRSWGAVGVFFRNSCPHVALIIWA